MKLIYQKYQNKNMESKAYCKWYGRVVIKGTVGIEELATKMQDNCTVKRADILAVLSELGPTVRDLLQGSYRVNIPYLGNFKLGMSTLGADKPENFSVRTHVKNVHVLYQPETHVTVDGRRVNEMVKDCRLEEDTDYVNPNPKREETGTNGGETPANGD